MNAIEPIHAICIKLQSNASSLPSLSRHRYKHPTQYFNDCLNGVMLRTFQQHHCPF